MSRRTKPARAVSAGIATAFVALCGLLAGAGAQAQTDSPELAWGDGSLAPSHGYLGLHVGQARFEPDCFSGLSCDDSETAFKLTAGGLASNIFSAEVGYVNMGTISASGGSQRAHGFNLSLVGSLPVGAGFSAFGKVGTTFGWTDTSSSVLGAQTGSDNGFGLSYGLGLGYKLSSQFEVVAEYERHNFKFAPGDQTLDLMSVGLRYQY